LTLIATQAPNEEKHEAVKEEFYSSLEKVCNTVPNYDMQTIRGDFNAKLEKKDSYLYPACGGHSLHNKTNDNGKQMVNFSLGRDLTVMGTWCQHKDIHKITWQSPDNKIYNQMLK